MLDSPILAREILLAPRRPRFHGVRAGAVALLFVLIWTAWQSINGFREVTRIGDIAHFHALLFPLMAFTQLGIALFAASLYGTSAISHEKDRRTFILLLVTRLNDAEIVVSKFATAILQVFTVLLSTLPVFALALLLGGVTIQQVLWVFAVTAGSAMAGAALGSFMAVWREKTFQAVALTLLVLALALIGVEALDAALGHVVLAGRPVRDWCAVLSPFRAVSAVLDPPEENRRWVEQRSALHVAFSGAVTVVLLSIASWKLRAWNPRGEPIQAEPTDDLGAQRSRAAMPTQLYRSVSGNPVLWREVRTRAYGHRPIVVKLAYLAIASVLLLGLWLALPPEGPPSNVSVARTLLPLGILSILLVNAQAVSSVTSERDIRALDLLLVTDVTAKEFIFGKLAGVTFNVKEMLLAPVVALVFAAIVGALAPLTFVYCLIAYLVMMSFAMVLGIHAAMRYDSSRVALANSLATVFLLFVGILLCLFLILISGRFETQWASFILFIVMGSVGLWLSLSANHPSNAIALTAGLTPVATFYCIVSTLVGDRFAPFLVGTGVYGFAVASLLIPLVSEFDVATGRTTADEG